jgi:glutathione S-transferase
VDEMLAEKTYLCTSSQLSIVDLTFYNEISNIMYLDGYQMRKGDYPNLYKWLKRLGEVKEVVDADE